MVKLKKNIIITLITLILILTMLTILCIKYNKRNKFLDPFNYKIISDNSIKITKKKQPKIKSLNIRNGTGLGKDFNVYLDVLDEGKFTKSSNHSQLIIQDDNVITIEHIPKETRKIGYIFIPNQELINKEDEESLLTPGKVRIVLCKSNYAASIFDAFRIKYTCLWKVYNFIFPPILTTMFYNYSKDRNVFLHPAGKSHMKNTTNIVKAWSGNPNWPLLIITCSDGCLSVHHTIRNTISKCKNIKLYTFLSKKQLNLLQKHSGYVILPSACEGFGHSIYEALENGNLLITSDIPPLNESLEHNHNCLMIQPDSYVNLGSSHNELNWIDKLSDKIGSAGSYCVNISIEEIENIVNKSLLLTDEDYNQIRLNAIEDLYIMISYGKQSLKNIFQKSGLIVKSS